MVSVAAKAMPAIIGKGSAPSHGPNATTIPPSVSIRIVAQRRHQPRLIGPGAINHLRQTESREIKAGWFQTEPEIAASRMRSNAFPGAP